MDPLSSVIAQLGLGVASNVIYDVAKHLITRRQSTSPDELAKELRTNVSILSVEGANILGQTVIDVFAKNGWILIKGTQLFATDAIMMRSTDGTGFSFGDGSSSSTSKTRIDAGLGAKIVGQGGAGIRQNEDGSIGFFT
jgi:hypothetical protein